MATPPRWHTGISDLPLSVEAAAAFIADPRAGATVTFTGVVRDHAADEGGAGDVRAVTGLDYEAWTEQAEARLAELAAETSAKWPEVLAGWAVHRVGRLGVGDIAVVVAVASAHRDVAFDAGRWLIDTLKATAPIWKREHWADGGSHWPGTD